jgi:hypothetical protein
MASSDPSDGDDEREVLSGLPNARPHRRSAKRDRATDAAASAKAKPAAKPKADPAAKPKAKPKTPTQAAPPKSTVPPAGYATPRDDGPHGADLVGTAVQAVGELAQIGLAAGGRAIKSAIQRLPRP